MKPLIKFIFSIACVLFLLKPQSSYSQVYGNEWINYNQTYYIIKIHQEGLYRIPYSTLISYIPNISGLNPNLIALYKNGQQQPLYVSASGSFNPSDYIEFFGEPNDGTADSVLYSNPDFQPHPYYSLFTDTAYYYLTVNPTPANLRYLLQTNDLTNLPPKENSFNQVSRVLSNNSVFEGKPYYVGPDPLFVSFYDEGEGYCGRTYFGSVSDGNNQTVNLTIPVPTPNVYSNGPVTLKTVYANNSIENHQVEIRSNNTLVISDNQFGFKLKKLQASLNIGDISNGTTNISYTVTDNSVSKRQNALFLTEIQYPHSFDFESKNSFRFRLPASSFTKRYIEVTNFDQGTSGVFLYDLTNRLRINVANSGSNPLAISLPPSLDDRELLLQSEASVISISQLSPISFVNYGAIQSQGNYLIISHSSLQQPFNGLNLVEEWRKYRDIVESPITGKYTARVYDIDQLIHQFAFGIQKSPLAIKRFLSFASNQFSVINKPEYVLLLGKGHEYNKSQRTHPSNTASTNNTIIQNQLKNLIPTFGYPGSDILLSCFGSDGLMKVNIGRVAAKNTQQLADYFQKLKDYETEKRLYNEPQSIQGKIWQKNVLHFGGGTGFSEQQQFKFYLNNYAQIARDTLWGANVNSYFKNSSAPIDETLSQQIKSSIENGVSLITFFGHSSSGAFDVSIDEPENYNNYLRYPFIIANGCFSGDLHGYGQAYSERFVLSANKGSIAFFATSGLSVPQGLNLFSLKMYQNFNGSSYNQPFSRAVKTTFNDIISQNPGQLELMSALEFTLHGDPALSLNQYIKPDYAIDESSVFFNPSAISPGQDSFQIKVVVSNLGKAVDDSLAITVKRTCFNQNNAPVIYNYRIDVPATFYKDTFSITIPTIYETLGYGQNLFDVFVEADLLIDEMSEQNNYLLNKISVYIQNDDILPVYPYEFAIVPQQGVVLKASTVNPFAPLRTYKFEIDSTEKFNSSLKQVGTIIQSGGVVHWKPNLIMQDSMVYYWRVAQDTSNAIWHYSSFIYIAGEYPGWNQSHLFQYQKDDYVNLKLDSNDRLFKFPSLTNEIRVKTGIYPSQLSANELGWYYNNSNMYIYRMGGCGFSSGITFAIIDSATGLPWSSINNTIDNWGDKFGNFHCSDKYYLQYGFDFKSTGTTPANHNLYPNVDWGIVVKNFLDSVPSGAYILVYSVNNPNYQNWNGLLYQQLTSIGFPYSSQLQNGTINGPFVYFTQKGNPSFSPITAVNPTFTTLDTSFTFPGATGSGFMSSTKIGPASEWNSIHWRPVSKENPSTDSDTLYVYGISTSNQETLLLTTTTFDNLNLNSIIPAQQFPYIRLKQWVRDPIQFTPSQLDYWRVLYKKVPEAALNPSAYFNVSNPVGVGQNFEVSVALENLTELPMDSVLTKYTLLDPAFSQIQSFVRYDSLQPLDTMILQFDYPIQTQNFVGLNKLIIEANPNNDQPEQFHFNNIAEFTFSATGDVKNPLLDVTFDGRHIMNKDIVSSKPFIVATLKDENTFLALDDTSLIDVYLKYPGENTPRRFSFDNNILTFYPAVLSSSNQRNQARCEFKPVLLTDGVYELIIKDKDRSLNNSSTVSGRFEDNINFDFKISFEVINKPMITNFLNWPNPFTTSTRFVFTITGSEIPDFMKIQIMNIKGTVVKEIFRDELGPLHIGENITEYAWDATDQYGDALANGVYFYRVVTSMNGQRMESLSKDYDKYFKKGFGKMVLVR